MTTPQVPDDWPDQDEFWEGLYELMFDPDRIERGEREVQQIIRLTGLESPATIVDLCCGPGRHSIALARQGHRVTGVDRTAKYLAVARERAGEAGVEADFVQADARDYRHPSGADIVLNLWTSFGYFAKPQDNQTVIQQAFDSLCDGGRLVLQTRSRETFASHVTNERTWWERDGVLYLEERGVVEGWQRTYGRWIVVDGDTRRDFRYLAWLYTGDELAAMMRAAGFTDVRLYGDLSGTPYDHHAKSLVAVARR